MIAISGGEGFVGGALVRLFGGELSTDGSQQISPGDLEGGQIERSPTSYSVLSIVRGKGRVSQGNVLHIGVEHPELVDYLQEVRFFVHTAGRLRGDWPALEAGNVGSVRSILPLLPLTLQQVVHFSSVNVLFSEDDPYGRSKLLGEQAWLASPFADRLTILRPSLIYGPGDQHNTVRLISLVRRLPLLLLPASRLRPIYVDDVVALVQAVLFSETGKGETWIVSGVEETSMVEMASIIANDLGLRRIILPLSVTWLRAAARLAVLPGLSKRLRNLARDKTWHDPLVWRLLEGKTTRLADGLRRSF
jgi:nucleoside-diphosphate-sugar epimerase